MADIDFYVNTYGGSADISQSELIKAGLIIDSVYCGISPVTEKERLLYDFGICAQAEYIHCMNGSDDRYRKISLGDFSAELSDGGAGIVSEKAKAYLDGIYGGIRCAEVNI